MCEYSHAMGNSCGGLAAYWAVIRRHGVLQGGCIWDWVDQGLTLAGGVGGAERFGYGGDFGPDGTPSDEAFCINGLVQPDRRPNPHAHEAKYCQQPIGVEGVSAGPLHAAVRVHNRHDFLPLSPGTFSSEWLLLEDGCPVRRGSLLLPTCAPQGALAPGDAPDHPAPLPTTRGVWRTGGAGRGGGRTLDVPPPPPL